MRALILAPLCQDDANPALNDLVYQVGGLLPGRLRTAIAGYSFTCLPMQLHAVSVLEKAQRSKERGWCCASNYARRVTDAYAGRFAVNKRPRRCFRLAALNRFCSRAPTAPTADTGQPAIKPWAPPCAAASPHPCLQVSLALFASFIAPFGGFFASGFKRGFKIKARPRPTPACILTSQALLWSPPPIHATRLGSLSPAGLW
jgi:hypothetical protein